MDGAGKTMFADALARVMTRPVVRVSVDDFHQVRALRYVRGRDSAEGFWLDSYDYGRLRADVLDPLGPGGSRRCSVQAHDLDSDAVLAPAWLEAPADAVLVLDGIFLQRPELAGCFELRVFLQVPFAETARRMLLRDGPSTSDRYRRGQELYLAACDPAGQADVLVDNTDYRAPRLLRG